MRDNLLGVLGVLIYITFLVWGVLINVFLLSNPFTCLPTILYILYINFGGGSTASKSGETWQAAKQLGCRNAVLLRNSTSNRFSNMLRPSHHLMRECSSMWKSL